MGFDSRKMHALIRSKDHKCSNLKSFQLNYPSFIVLFKHSDHGTHKAQFNRTVTNVGKPIITYVVYVASPAYSKVKVSPDKLELYSHRRVTMYLDSFLLVGWHGLNKSKMGKISQKTVDL